MLQAQHEEDDESAARGWEGDRLLSAKTNIASGLNLAVFQEEAVIPIPLRKWNKHNDLGIRLPNTVTQPGGFRQRINANRSESAE